MPSTYVEVTLNSSGAVTSYPILPPTQGILTTVRLKKLGQTNNPSVTLEAYPDGEDILTAISVNANATYHPSVQLQSAAGSNLGTYIPFPLVGQGVSLTVTGGDNAGVVGVTLEWL